MPIRILPHTPVCSVVGSANPRDQYHYIVVLGGNWIGMECTYLSTGSMISLERASSILPNHRGFTLIELMLVVALVALTAMIVIPSYTAYMVDAKIQTAKADIYRIEMEIERFKFSSGGNPPNSLSDINMDSLLDPWGNPYQLLNHALAENKGKLRKDKNLVPLNSDYDLYSKGKDSLSVPPLTAKQSQDDIVRANNGDYVGLASEY
jgi:general secretion pathway protein G